MIDELARTARVGEARLPLTRKEFDLLAVLTRQAGRVVSAERLLDSGWSYEGAPNAGLVDVYMSRLRTKLSRAGSSVRIVNVRGVGYRLEVTDG